MKKGVVSMMIALLLCTFLAVGASGLDFSAEGIYDIDTSETTSELEAIFGWGLVDLGLTLDSNWSTSTNALTLEAGVTQGMFGLELEKDLLSTTPGEATLTLTRAPFVAEYEYIFDGADTGELTVTYTIAPFVIEYNHDFDLDTWGTVEVGFTKTL